MATLLEIWQKANTELIRLFSKERLIVPDSIRLKIQGVMHELALAAFRTGHESGSELRAKQIAEICGSVMRESSKKEENTYSAPLRDGNVI